ncbi:MAG: imidazolonepropionase [Acidimicrobiaceae bacterium]|nr:imidazolonepropionase [Acidimicrobiaceae bacterium]
MSTRVLRHIGELTTNDPTQGDQSAMGRILNAAMVLDEHEVLWTGPDAKAPAADEMIDVAHCAVVPGFVDSHTHLVFAGERSDEFEARMAGRPYDGGGILRTVASTRKASAEQLREATSKRSHELRLGGVTTLEVKSGYELTLDGEARLVGLAREVTAEVTFLGAHVVPEEFGHDREGYVQLVAGAMLEACTSEAKWADVFCDRGAFDVDEARLVLTSARRAGLGVRLHANQLADIGAISLGVELDAASVDHCTHVSDADLEALGASRTVATLLPGAEFSTRSPYPSARRFLDAGVCVALASDCNPGTSYVTSMGLVIALAVREMGMTPDEALYAATRGGAMALRRDDIGRLSPGSRADVVVLDAPRSAHLAYRPGAPLVRETLLSAP